MVPRHAARGGAAVALVCGALAGCSALLAGCTALLSDGQSGISREEHCAGGRPVITDISAVTDHGRVVLVWREPFRDSEPTTFRVYRRSDPASAWEQVAEVSFDGPDDRRHVDEPPVPAPRGLTYGVTKVDRTCGEGSLCLGHPPVQQCSSATLGPNGSSG